MIPSQNSAALTVMRAAADKITATPTDYGLVAGDATALDAAVTAAETAAADQATFETLKQSKTAAAQAALATALGLFRSDVAQAMANPDVTDEKLADLGASRRNPPSRIGAPSSAPEVSIEKLGVGFADLRIIEPNTRSAALPVDANGLEVSLVDGTVTSSDGEADLGVKTFQTKARCTVNTAIGKARLRVYVRYIGRRAQPGPWSLPAQFSPPQP